MGSPDPIAQLLGLADTAARGEPPDPSAAAWFARGVRRFLDGEPLETALGLSGEGWPARTRRAYAVRDEALRRAHAALGGDASDLARAVRRFEGAAWPRWRELTAPPSHASPVQRELFSAFAAGRPVPSSPRHLRRILRADTRPPSQ